MRNDIACRFRWPLLIILAGFLLGCGSVPGARDERGVTPASPDVLLADGDAALARGDLPGAAKAYRRAAQASDDEQVAEQATQAAFGHFQLKEASLSAERWLELNSTSEQARRYAGVTALKLHRLDDAEHHFSALIDTVYISPAAGYLALLPVISGEGTAPDVTELFRRLSSHHPEVAEGHYTLGAAALRSENFQLATQSAARALELAPYWTPPRMLQARALVAMGDDEAGLAVARELVAREGSDIATHLDYALLLAGSGRDEEARAMLTPYATGERIVPGAVRAMGMLDLQERDLDGATRRFEQLLSTGADPYEALYFLGTIAEQREDFDLALSRYARVDGGDRALVAQRRAAMITAKQSGPEAGLALLEEFGRNRPELGPDIVAARAGLMSALGDDAAAIAILDEGLQSYPDLTELQLARVFAHEQSGQVDAAVHDLRAMLEARPGDAVLQNALGFTLADHGLRLGEAQQLVAAALEQMPDSGAVLDSMGWVLFKQARYEDALAYLRRARELADYAEIDLHLGEVLWSMGEEDEARRVWTEGLERSPDDAALKERLQRANP
jgi:tetratricopeptide (TPR) repeat protein